MFDTPNLLIKLFTTSKYHADIPLELADHIMTFFTTRERNQLLSTLPSVCKTMANKKVQCIDDNLKNYMEK